MSINREKLKLMIDALPDEATAEVIDFIGYLNLKREREAMDQTNVELLSNDENLTNQVLKSREARKNGHVYDEDQGLKYLRRKVEEFESEQNL